MWDPNKSELLNHICGNFQKAELVFQNAYGRSQKLKVSGTVLCHSAAEEVSAFWKGHAEYVAGLMVRAKAGKIAAAACRNVVKKYPCGRQKQLLQEKFLNPSVGVVLQEDDGGYGAGHGAGAAAHELREVCRARGIEDLMPSFG